ncbi:MAG: AEC family transporter [Vibrio sp.]
MITVFSVILPIFLVILVGYFCAKMQLMNITSISQMGKFVLYIAMPSVIISTISKLKFDEIFNPTLLLAYVLPGLFMLTIGFVLYCKVFQIPKLDSAIMLTGSIVPNSAFIGFPILLQMMDNPKVSTFAIALLVENILIFPLCLLLLDWFNNKSQQASLSSQLSMIAKRIVKNPLLIAIIISLTINLLAIPIPNAIDRVLSIFAPSAVAVALFCIGGSLAQVKLRNTNWKWVSMTAVAKLLVHPLLVGLSLYFFMPNDKELAVSLMLVVSVPMLSIYTLIGDMYNRQEYCASTQFVTTILAVVTIPVVYFVFDLVV